MTSIIKKSHFLAKLNSREAPKLFNVLVDQFFMSITTLLTSVVLARTYDKIEYADLILLFSITLFVLGFQSAIISKPYAINRNDFDDNRIERYYHFNLHLKILFTLLTVIVFPLLYYVLFNSWDLTRLLIFTLYVVANTAYFFVRETLLSERKTKQNLYYGLSCSLGMICLLLVIQFGELADIYLFLEIASAIYLTVSGVYLLKNFRKRLFSKKAYLSNLKVNWKVGKWLLGSNVLFYLSSGVYPWLLLYLTTKSDIAIFGVLISAASIINPIIAALSSYLLPLFAKMGQNYGQIDGSVKKWALLFAVMASILVLTGYFFGQDIILLFFGEKYDDLGFLVIYPFVVQAINLTFQPFRISLDAIKRTDVNFWVLIPRTIIAIGLGYFLIDIYGLSGVFYTMIVENLTYQLINVFVYARLMKANKSVSTL